jgi:hypothetical protein
LLQLLLQLNQFQFNVLLIVQLVMKKHVTNVNMDSCHKVQLVSQFVELIV